MAELLSHQPNCDTAVALGYFDGVHLGHRAVIGRAVQEADGQLLPAVFTFSTGGGAPEKKKGAGALCTPEEKLDLLRQAGARVIASPDFEVIHGMSPQEFVQDILARQLRARVLCCGADFRFGKGAAAGVEELRAMGAPLGIRLCVVPAVLYQNAPVSSTRIREAVSAGDLPLAAALLGRRYSFAAPVVEGKHLGHKLDFPTINQPLPAGLCMPPPAVYAVWVQTPDGRWRMGVCNIGAQPTVGGSTPLAETFILDYSGDLYGRTVRLAPWRKLRDIRRFESVEQLRRCVLENARQAREILSQQPAEDLG